MDDSDDPTPHPGRMTLGPNDAHGLPPLQARIAQYPDCQQLQLWLPRDVAGGWTRLVVHDAAEALVFDEPMEALLQAGHRVLLDTLPWPPGALRLRIAHAGGGWLQLLLNKAGDDEPPVLPQPQALADEGSDLAFRRRAAERLAHSLARNVDCVPHGRGMRALYSEPGLQLAFEVEMGSDGLAMRLDAPAEGDWEACTGVALARRREILAFVAARLPGGQALSQAYASDDDGTSFTH